MRQDLTDITMVLDRSGSMASVREETISGVNVFLTEQRKQPGEATMSLVQFDDKYEPLYAGRRVQDAPDLNMETFVPRGYTALFDAVGKTIVATGERLNAMAEADRPAKVMFVIVTDGAENASREYTAQRLGEMIATQRNTYKWDFSFIGANQDAILSAAAINIPSGKAMSYAANAAGTQHAFASSTKYANTLRSANLADVAATSFDADDRKAQRDAGAATP